MREKTVHLLRRGSTLVASVAARFFAEGRLMVFIRGALFVGTASMVGLYLALTLFVPDELVLGKIRGIAASRGLDFAADDVGYSLFGSVILHDVVIRDTEGKEMLTVGSISLSPRLLPLFRGILAPVITFKNIGDAGGVLTFDYEPGDDFCASLKSRAAPLAITRLLWPTVEIEGTLDGDAEFCEEQKKATATADLRAEKVKLGGVVYGLTLDKPVNLGEVVIRAGTKEGKLEIEELSADGDFLLEASGKVTLNAQNYKNSRLELSAHIEEKRSGALQELPLLELALARFKNPNGTYAVKITGTLQSPAVRRDTAASRSSRIASKERENGTARRKEREKKKEEPSPAPSEPATSPAAEPSKGKTAAEEKTKGEEPDREPTKETAESKSPAKEESGKEHTRETEDNP